MVQEREPCRPETEGQSSVVELGLIRWLCSVQRNRSMRDEREGVDNK